MVSVFLHHLRTMDLQVLDSNQGDESLLRISDKDLISENFQFFLLR